MARNSMMNSELDWQYSGIQEIGSFRIDTLELLARLFLIFCSPFSLIAAFELFAFK